MHPYYLSTLWLASLALASLSPPACGPGHVHGIRCSSQIATRQAASTTNSESETIAPSSPTIIVLPPNTITSTPTVKSTTPVAPISDPTELYTLGTSFPTAIPRPYYIVFDNGSRSMYLSLGFNKNSSNHNDVTIGVGRDTGKYLPSIFRFDYLNKKFYTFDFTGQRYASLPLNPNYNVNDPVPRQLFLSTISQGPGNMVLLDSSSVDDAPPLLYHENLQVANAFVLCDRGVGENSDGERDLWAEGCPDGGFGTYGRGWLAVRYLW